MALTKTPTASLGQGKLIRDIVHRGGRLEEGTFAMDSEYATGGESISFPGFRSVVGVLIVPRSGYVFEYTGSKIKVWCQSSNVAGALTEVASSTDLSGLSSVPYLAFGY